jgi:hypothetical protein
MAWILFADSVREAADVTDALGDVGRGIFSQSCSYSMEMLPSNFCQHSSENFSRLGDTRPSGIGGIGLAATTSFNEC